MGAPVTPAPTINFDAFFSDFDGAAESGQEEEDLTAEQTFLVFRLGGQQFALPVMTVREILDPCPVAPLPAAPAIVTGMIDLRGESIVVLDISANLGVQPQALGAQRIVVFRTEAGSDRPIGILADQVLNVAEIPPAAMERPPQLDGADPMGVLCGVARIDGQLTLVLDRAGLLLAHPIDLSLLDVA